MEKEKKAKVKRKKRLDFGNVLGPAPEPPSADDFKEYFQEREALMEKSEKVDVFSKEAAINADKTSTGQSQSTARAKEDTARAKEDTARAKEDTARAEEDATNAEEGTARAEENTTTKYVEEYIHRETFHHTTDNNLGRILFNV